MFEPKQTLRRNSCPGRLTGLNCKRFALFSSSSAIRSNQMLPVDSIPRHRTETSVTSNLSKQTSADLCSYFCRELSERLAVQYSACQKHTSEGVSLERSKGDDQTDIPGQDEEVESSGVSKPDSIQAAEQTKNNIKYHEASRTISCSPTSNRRFNTVNRPQDRYSPHPGSPSFKPTHLHNQSELGAVSVPNGRQNGRVAALVKRLEELSTLQPTVPVGNPMQPPQNKISKATSYFTGYSRSLDRFGSTKKFECHHNRPVSPDKCCNDLQTDNVGCITQQHTTETYSKLPSLKSPKTFSKLTTDPQGNNRKLGDLKVMVAPPEHPIFTTILQLKPQSEAPLAVTETTPYPITRLKVHPLPAAPLFNQYEYQSTPFTQTTCPLSSCIGKKWSPGDHLSTHPHTSGSKMDQTKHLKRQPSASSNEQSLLDGMIEQEQSELVARLLKKTEVANPDVTTEDSDLHRDLEATVTQNTESNSRLTRCPRLHRE
ncbi:uncharacterized protein DEA37_0005088 [Paragonimus westermani]|uniref:Uncharacterized protein n=1 Tax=Paragonimus westermani TaxID=34504 RepID=A0A5J4NBU1_9TREM|nr:uncharacterized protein DEA37_0005088 [Paragonimus westermani]